MNIAAQARTLKAINQSLYGDMIDPAQMYDGAIPPEAQAQWDAAQRTPTQAEVVDNLRRAIAWHAQKQLELASEIAGRSAQPEPHVVLLDEARRTLAYHRGEQARCEALLQELGQ